MKLTKHMKARLGWVARMAAVVAVAAFGLARSPAAWADTVMLKVATDLVYGSSEDTFSLTAPSAGTISAQVYSSQWPTTLSALSFNLTDASQTLTPVPMASAQSVGAADTSALPQVESYQVGAGTYFGHVLATAGPGPFNAGLYTAIFTFTPSAVPVPAAAGMLLLGLLMLFALRRTLRDGALDRGAAVAVGA